MPPKKIQIYKLKATDGPLSRDDLSTWVFTVKAYARQNDMTKFINGDKKTWTCSDEDDSNGMIAFKADHVTEDPVKTNELIGEFHDFLTTVAANCPTGFTDTVIRESTSFTWIVESIKKTFKLITKGENFLDGLDIKFEFDENFTYSQAWMTLKDHYISALLPSNSKCMGKLTTSKETLSPLATNFLVREWLMKIHPKLPAHIKNSRGHLFTEEKPTLACNQSILCDQMEILLQELDAKDGTSTNNVSVGYIPNGRGRGNPPGMLRGSNFPRGGRFQRGRGQQFNLRQPASARRQPSCQICLEARKYDSAIGHTTQACPFKQELSNITRQQQRPNFKVLLLPSETPSTLNNSSHQADISTAPASSNQQVQYNPYYTDGYGHTSYPDQYTYEDEYYTAPFNHYEQATIEEVNANQQDL